MKGVFGQQALHRANSVDVGTPQLTHCGGKNTLARPCNPIPNP
jgi:hypothetical protein